MAAVNYNRLTAVFVIADEIDHGVGDFTDRAVQNRDVSGERSSRRRTVTTTAAADENLTVSLSLLDGLLDAVVNDLEVFCVSLHQRSDALNLLAKLAEMLRPLFQEGAEIKPASVLLA